ncbi:hypothetical protein AGDE_14161 [Angomonas deanei]|uniref:Uncharacterized protein n=1 Tax=Angomonas deanei TaxID=59799 RepID=A0A7G2C0I6_9TRYP|nr:hypothetical protein AGDE_14161 [Angomonas deanei]CAD2212711.1 hypothetical protein, conserved [Angomonas deanei]|eukprot:EPY21325.1 hypothetical protein AGDE_14161 [Angomonas deanei]
MNLEQGRHELERENTRLQDKLFYLTQAKEPVVINQYTERCPSRSGVSHLNNSKEVSSMTATGRTAHHTPTPVPPSADSAPPPVSDICVSPKRVEVAQPSVQLRAGNVSGGSPYNDISLCDNEEALRQEVELWKSRCMRLLDTKEKEGVERSKVSVTPVERSALSQHNASTQTTEQHNRKEKKQERVHTPADVSRGQAEQPTMTTQNAVDAFPASLNGPPPGHLFMNTSGNLAVAPPPYVDTGSPSHYGAVVTPFPTPFVQPYIHHYDSLRHQESRDRIERDIRRNDQLLAAISKLQSTASMHGPRKTT